MITDDLKVKLQSIYGDDWEDVVAQVAEESGRTYVREADQQAQGIPEQQSEPVQSSIQGEPVVESTVNDTVTDDPYPTLSKPLKDKLKAEYGDNWVDVVKQVEQEKNEAQARIANESGSTLQRPGDRDHIEALQSPAQASLGGVVSQVASANGLRRSDVINSWDKVSGQLIPGSSIVSPDTAQPGKPITDQSVRDINRNAYGKGDGKTIVAKAVNSVKNAFFDPFGLHMKGPLSKVMAFVENSLNNTTYENSTMAEFLKGLETWARDSSDGALGKGNVAGNIIDVYDVLAPLAVQTAMSAGVASSLASTKLVANLLPKLGNAGTYIASRPKLLYATTKLVEDLIPSMSINMAVPAIATFSSEDADEYNRVLSEGNSLEAAAATAKQVAKGTAYDAALSLASSVTGSFIGNRALRFLANTAISNRLISWASNGEMSPTVATMISLPYGLTSIMKASPADVQNKLFQIAFKALDHTDTHNVNWNKMLTTWAEEQKTAFSMKAMSELASGKNPQGYFLNTYDTLKRKARRFGIDLSNSQEAFTDANLKKTEAFMHAEGLSPVDILNLKHIDMSFDNLLAEFNINTPQNKHLLIRYLNDSGTVIDDSLKDIFNQIKKVDPKAASLATSIKYHGNAISDILKAKQAAKVSAEKADIISELLNEAGTLPHKVVQGAPKFKDFMTAQARHIRGYVKKTGIPAEEWISKFADRYRKHFESIVGVPEATAKEAVKSKKVLVARIADMLPDDVVSGMSKKDIEKMSTALSKASMSTAPIREAMNELIKQKPGMWDKFFKKHTYADVQELLYNVMNETERSRLMHFHLDKVSKNRILELLPKAYEYNKDPELYKLFKNVMPVLNEKTGAYEFNLNWRGRTIDKEKAIRLANKRMRSVDELVSDAKAMHLFRLAAGQGVNMPLLSSTADSYWNLSKNGLLPMVQKISDADTRMTVEIAESSQYVEEIIKQLANHHNMSFEDMDKLLRRMVIHPELRPTAAPDILGFIDGFITPSQQRLHLRRNLVAQKLGQDLMGYVEDGYLTRALKLQDDISALADQGGPHLAMTKKAKGNERVFGAYALKRHLSEEELENIPLEDSFSKIYQWYTKKILGEIYLNPIAADLKTLRESPAMSDTLKNYLAKFSDMRVAGKQSTVDLEMSALPAVKKAHDIVFKVADRINGAVNWVNDTFGTSLTGLQKPQMSPKNFVKNIVDFYISANMRSKLGDRPVAAIRNRLQSSLNLLWAPHQALSTTYWLKTFKQDIYNQICDNFKDQITARKYASGIDRYLENTYAGNRTGSMEAFGSADVETFKDSLVCQFIGQRKSKFYLEDFPELLDKKRSIPKWAREKGLGKDLAIDQANRIATYKVNWSYSRMAGSMSKSYSWSKPLTMFNSWGFNWAHALGDAFEHRKYDSSQFYKYMALYTTGAAAAIGAGWNAWSNWFGFVPSQVGISNELKAVGTALVGASQGDVEKASAGVSDLAGALALSFIPSGLSFKKAITEIIPVIGDVLEGTDDKELKYWITGKE